MEKDIKDFLKAMSDFLEEMEKEEPFSDLNETVIKGLEYD